MHLYLYESKQNFTSELDGLTIAKFIVHSIYLRGYCNEDTEYVIVNFLPFEKCAEHYQYLMKLDSFVPFW